MARSRKPYRVLIWPGLGLAIVVTALQEAFICCLVGTIIVFSLAMIAAFIEVTDLKLHYFWKTVIAVAISLAIVGVVLLSHAYYIVVLATNTIPRYPASWDTSNVPIIRKLVSFHPYARYKIVGESVRVTSLIVADSGIADVDLVNIFEVNDFKSVGFLDVSQTAITDTALRSLQNAPSLFYVDVSNTHVTNAGLCDLTALPAVRDIEANGISIDDKGVQCCVQAKTLKTLSLNNTFIDDKSILDLKRMDWLEELQIKNTRISRAGIKALRSGLKHCNVIADE